MPSGLCCAAGLQEARLAISMAVACAALVWVSKAAFLAMIPSNRLSDVAFVCRTLPQRVLCRSSEQSWLPCSLVQSPVPEEHVAMWPAGHAMSKRPRASQNLCSQRVLFAAATASLNAAKASDASQMDAQRLMGHLSLKDCVLSMVLSSWCVPEP